MSSKTVEEMEREVTCCFGSRLALNIESMGMRITKKWYSCLNCGRVVSTAEIRAKYAEMVKQKGEKHE